jgi:hypothetical protein
MSKSTLKLRDAVRLLYDAGFIEIEGTKHRTFYYADTHTTINFPNTPKGDVLYGHMVRRILAATGADGATQARRGSRDVRLHERGR